MGGGERHRHRIARAGVLDGVQVAGHEVAGLGSPEAWGLLGAQVHGVRAPGAEAAAARRIERARHLPLDLHLLGAPGARVEVLGNRDQDASQARIKAVRITIEGRDFDFYPERIPPGV